MHVRWRELGNFELRLRQVQACKVFQNFDPEWGDEVEVQSFNDLKKVREFGWTESAKFQCSVGGTENKLQTLILTDTVTALCDL